MPQQIFQEDELIEGIPEGHFYILSSEEPLIVNEEGVPVRRFELGSHGLIELPIEDEPITKVDLEEVKKRRGGHTEDRVYDILEVGYWCGDDYTEYDQGYIDFREDSQDWIAEQNALDNAED